MTIPEQSRDEPDTAEMPAVGVAEASSESAPTPRGGSERGRDAVAGLVVLVALAILSLPLGALWRVLAPRVEMIRVDGGWALREESPEQYIGDDGLFALMGVGAGILAALLVWFLVRRHRGPFLLTGLALGGIACQTLAWRFGRMGREDFVAGLDHVKPGWRVWRVPDLLMVDFNPANAWHSAIGGDLGGAMNHLSLGVLATMAFAAAFTYTVCSGWSKSPSLRGGDEDDLDPSPRNTPQSEASGQLPSLGAETH
ncbi:MAG TPA: DUF2567 domain-containing protein [Stackebrandtia sp.]|jgi:hypothetical protein|uniref:DUF2567 domain-containing protein n=1 Tax=Stackebrandtia sp. TaxID=2023065 RepID=UPI002D6BC011|nr:DUF2567 domain-containing protein [Stackebrandtia sp.]HZE38495.1 DUF2567 domain-containing protein [Stackebrandtia sp.]